MTAKPADLKSSDGATFSTVIMNVRSTTVPSSSLKLTVTV